MIRQPIPILLTLFFCAATTVAQDRSAAVQALPPSSRAAVATEDIWTHIPSIDVANGRIDEELGILRAAYRLNPAMMPRGTPEATVRTWLTMDGQNFGIRTPEVLELIREKETIGAHHLTFQQTLAGVKVYERFVHVNLNRAGLPITVASDYAPHLENVDTFNPVPALSATQAESLAQRAVSSTGATIISSELLVLPDGPPRLIWRTMVWTDSVPGEWEVILDANTGDLIRLMDLRLYSRPDPPSKADGEGLIWWYDPLTASGESYGGDYADNNDRDNATLNSLLETVTLRDIEYRDGLYRLNGPWVRILGPHAPEEEDASNFKYTRSDKRFEAVMVYHFVDQSQRYIEALDVGHPPPSKPIGADPHVYEEDNSFFLPLTNFMGFGDGGIDDAEDVGVILHEYGHAIMNHYHGFIPRPTAQQGALGEGFSDYWAVSYRRSLMDRGVVPAGDWKEVFPWDGIAWGGRRADGNHHYSEIKDACRLACNIYRYGRTWAALMMELWGAIGRENADRLHLAAFSYLGRNFTFTDMAAALVTADEALYNGIYTDEIYDIFGPKGFLSSRIGVPTITHTPVSRHPDLSVPIAFEADIAVTGAEVNSVNVHYRLNGGEFTELAMSPRPVGTAWWIEFQLPDTSKFLEYYIHATTNFASTTSPKTAPLDLWSLHVGPDTRAPTITYTPVTHVTLEEIKEPLSVQVTDENAVSKVILEYTIHDPRNETAESSILSLQVSNADIYTFSIPFSRSPGASLAGLWAEYRIVAYDDAVLLNRAVFPPPEETPLRLDVIPDSLQLGVWNPDEWTKLASGEWGYDDYVFGYQGDLWVTAPDTSYSDQPTLSLLSFPDVNVAGYPNAHLEFWHWYDFEHVGVPEPEATAGIVYDGGQVQLSTDGGQSWTIAEPQWSYNGNVESTLSNPLAGTPAYGGSSFGWRRVRVPLPDAPPGAYRFEVITRLAFGTGTGNSHSTTDNFAGWAVRDVRVVADPPVETNTPVVRHAPFAHQFIPPDETTVPIQVAASDDTGIESVRLHLFRVEEPRLERIDSYRLAPLQARLDWFEAAIPIPELQLGVELGYFITIQDFDKNEHILGEMPPGELLKLYLPSESPRPALSNGHRSGAWTNSGDGYLARTNTSARQSSIVLAPVYFADLPERTMLRLRHSYDLGEESQGRLSVTENSGDTWEVLEARTGFSDMDKGDRGRFSGQSPQIMDSWFDLTSLRRPFQLRLELIQGRRQKRDGFWEIFDAEYYWLNGSGVSIPAPEDLILYPNFPNPFRDETTINYILPEAMHVRITIFNILGRDIQNVTNREYEAGGHAINLNLHSFAPGVYWIRMEAGNKILQQPITLVH